MDDDFYGDENYEIFDTDENLQDTELLRLIFNGLMVFNNMDDNLFTV